MHIKGYFIEKNSFVAEVTVKEEKTLTKYCVDHQETAVLSYSVIGLCPELMTVDFYMKKKLISDYSINNTLNKCLKKLSSIF